MPRHRKTRTRKSGFRFSQSDDQPAESLYPGTGTQLDARPPAPRTRRKRTLKKGGKLRNKL